MNNYFINCQNDAIFIVVHARSNFLKIFHFFTFNIGTEKFIDKAVCQDRDISLCCIDAWSVLADNR